MIKLNVKSNYLNQMTEQFLLELIKKGESTSIEFKQSHDKLNKDAFDTICSFLNRKGGTFNTWCQ